MTAHANAIQLVVPPPQRGAEPRVLNTSLEQLNPRQREILSFLPRDRRGSRPLLRGPNKAMAERRHEVFGIRRHGQVHVASFSFDVPEQVQDTDVPALIDAWAMALEQARKKLILRIEKGDKRLLRKAADLKDSPSRGAVGADLSTDLRQQSQVPAPDPAHSESVDPAQALRAALRLAQLLPDIALPFNDGAPASLLLDDFNWTGVCMLTRFDLHGLEVVTVREGLDGRFGDAWRHVELQEDLHLRCDQAMQLVTSAHAELVSLGKGLRPRRPNASDAERQALLVADVDLLRYLFVDLSLAPAHASDILAEPTGFPDWLLSYAELTEQLRPQIDRSLSSTDVQARMALLKDWVKGLKPQECGAQLGLWATDCQAGLQRVLVHHLERAKAWSKILETEPARALVALAAYALVG